MVGLKKQKADASVIKTIKAAAAPSAMVRDQSNELKKESKRDFGEAAVCRYIFGLVKGLQIHGGHCSNHVQIVQPSYDTSIFKWMGKDDIQPKGPKQIIDTG